MEVMTSTNFKEWKQDVEFAMEMLDVDLAMTTSKPAKLTTTISDVEKQAYASWMKSNPCVI